MRIPSHCSPVLRVVLIVMMTITIASGCSKQVAPTPAARFSNLIVYSADGFVDRPPKDLSSYRSHACDPNIVGPLLRNMVHRVKEPSIWKISRVIELELDDGTHVTGTLGYVGHFVFKIHGQRGIYELQDSGQDEWHALITDALERASRNNTTTQSSIAP